MKTQIILALDVNSAEEAYSIIEETHPYVDCFKVGSILYTREGNSIVKKIKSFEKKVFLDLKFFDIPNTVKGVSEVTTSLGVDMFTIHLLGGSEMIKAALEGTKALSNTSLILGVTILTSFDEETIQKELKINLSLEEMVLHLAKMGYECGIRGFVCSPHETRLLKESISNDIVVVTPGIRLAKDNKDDQKRIMTPRMAKEAGADFIVVGRSILNQSDRLRTLSLIREEII